MKQKLGFEPRWYAVIVFFFAGVFLGAFVLFLWIFNGGAFYGIQKIHPTGKGDYKFISPLLAVDVNQPLNFFAHNQTENKITSLIDQEKKSGRLSGASVYFQDLENGEWFNVNPDDKFLTGKTLKVPIMIAYFKAAEADPAILRKKLVYQTQANDTSASSQVDLEDGGSYPIEEFLRDMIIDDSNSSAAILFRNIDKKALGQVYSDLSIPYAEDLTSDDYINVKQNSLFYRILYNATYLSREDSEKALEIISESDVGTGATAALPQNLKVAHRHPPDQQGARQAGGMFQSSDCGIVYYPGHPYIFCAMATGKDRGSLEGFLTQAGSVAYQDMFNKYKN